MERTKQQEKQIKDRIKEIALFSYFYFIFIYSHIILLLSYSIIILILFFIAHSYSCSSSIQTLLDESFPLIRFGYASAPSPPGGRL